MVLHTKQYVSLSSLLGVNFKQHVSLHRAVQYWLYLSYAYSFKFTS